MRPARMLKRIDARDRVSIDRHFDTKSQYTITTTGHLQRDRRECCYRAIIFLRAEDPVRESCVCLWRGDATAAAAAAYEVD